MNSHKNARLTRLGRVHMMEQIANIGLQTAADQAGISVRRARMWRKRWDESGEDGLCDRSSRPHVSPRRTSPDKQERIINLRPTIGYPIPSLPAVRASRPQPWGVFVQRPASISCRPSKMRPQASL